MSVKHTFISSAPSSEDPNKVGSDEWNAEHTVLIDLSSELDENSISSIGEVLAAGDKFLVLNVSTGQFAWAFTSNIALYTRGIIFDEGSFSDGEIPRWNADDSNLVSTNLIVGELGTVKPAVTPVVDNRIVTFNGTTGKSIKDSGVLLSDLQTALSAQPHIADADGTLADLTTKFNTLLGYLENLGLLNTA